MIYSTPLFFEVQKFKQWWIWLILFGINGISLFGIYKQLILGEQFGNKPLSDLGLIIITTFILLFNFSFYLFKLETQIKTDGIYVRFFPFHRAYRFYPWDKLTKCYVREYSPLMEYGGWGLRGFGDNRALNVSGKIGLQLIFVDSKKILIGTQKPDQLKQILEKINQYKI